MEQNRLVPLTQASPETSAAIDYQGVGAIVTVTAAARAILERYGYSFPVIDGRLSWDLPDSGCVEFDVSEEDAHSSLVLHMQDVDTPEGTSVFLCRTYTMKRDGRYNHSHLLFRPVGMPKPFRELESDDPFVKEYCCLHDHQ